MGLSRRTFLTGAGALALHAGVTTGARAGGDRKVLRLESREIEVAGRAATRYGVSEGSGGFGLTLDEGDAFNVRLENALAVPSGIHWHGLTGPWRQDGVPYLSAPPIAPGQSRDYGFPARPPGTRFMHSHFGLQEQNLLAAPLIIREASAIGKDAQEVVVVLEDFSWKPPQEIFDGLREPPSGGMAKMDQAAGPDLNDVQYDAYLANDRTLDDPETIAVERSGEVRLRLINASAATNFTIDLGTTPGTLIAVDGNPIAPLSGSRFPLAIAQRADILLRMPVDGTALPVLALGEGRRLRTGVLLRPAGAAIAKLASEAEGMGPQVGLDQELLLTASAPLPAKAPDRSIPVDLTGTMMGYHWGMPIDGVAGLPASVEHGERVEIIFRNTTPMSHPMHLHGHVFQVIEINRKVLQGAIRDSLLVPPKTTVKVAFDADNPGLWAFHCHNLYHMAAGMFSTLLYRGFS